MRLLWFPAFAPDHPSDQDLSPGTPGKARKWGTEILLLFYTKTQSLER